MEGKKARFGTTQSTLWAQATKAASNGSVNAIQDSFRQIGKVIFGGVGAVFHGMLLYLVLAAFLAGMMVGRTPEYLGKKPEWRDVTLAVPGLLWTSVGILILARWRHHALPVERRTGFRPAWPVRDPLCLQLGYRQ